VLAKKDLVDELYDCLSVSEGKNIERRVSVVSEKGVENIGCCCREKEKGEEADNVGT